MFIPREDKIVHAGQRVWMVRSQFPASFGYMNAVVLPKLLCHCKNEMTACSGTVYREASLPTVKCEELFMMVLESTFYQLLRLVYEDFNVM